LDSQWVWFEVGLMIGMGKDIIPFALSEARGEGFINKLPEFIRQFNLAVDSDRLCDAVRENLFEFGKLSEDAGFNRRIFPKLKAWQLTLSLNISEHLAEHLQFGCLLIRFGREDTLEHTANLPLLQDAAILNKPIFGRQRRSEESTATKVEFVVPVHAQLGLKYKLFLQLRDGAKLDDAIQMLEANGMKDVARSGSVEAHRVYFLLPLEGHQEVKSPDGILDNYIYPE